MANGVTMPYTNEQLQRFNQRPANTPKYNTIQFYNAIAGYKRILVAGSNGPYFDKDFMVSGQMETFQAVSCEIPDVTSQDTDSNNVGSIRFGRIGTDVVEYLQAIDSGVLIPSDTVIEVRLALYEGESTTPMFERIVYVGKDGVSIGSQSVSINLQVDNPAKIQYVPFYNTDDYIGLEFG